MVASLIFVIAWAAYLAYLCLVDDETKKQHMVVAWVVLLLLGLGWPLLDLLF